MKYRKNYDPSSVYRMGPSAIATISNIYYQLYSYIKAFKNMMISFFQTVYMVAYSMLWAVDIDRDGLYFWEDPNPYYPDLQLEVAWINGCEPFDNTNYPGAFGDHTGYLSFDYMIEYYKTIDTGFKHIFNIGYRNGINLHVTIGATDIPTYIPASPYNIEHDLGVVNTLDRIYLKRNFHKRWHSHVFVCFVPYLIDNIVLENYPYGLANAYTGAFIATDKLYDLGLTPTSGSDYETQQTQVIMHEVGHTINIIRYSGLLEEDYDSHSGNQDNENGFYETGEEVCVMGLLMDGLSTGIKMSRLIQEFNNNNHFILNYCPLHLEDLTLTAKYSTHFDAI